VKDRFKIWFIAFLIAIYGHAVGVVTYSALFSDELNIQPTTDRSIYTDFSVKNCFVHSQTQNSFNPFWSFKSSVVQNIDWGMWAIVVAADLIIRTAFSHYKLISGEISWNCRKSLLIFPFHTFW